jgi:hypothetical protein
MAAMTWWTAIGASGRIVQGDDPPSVSFTVQDDKGNYLIYTLRSADAKQLLSHLSMVIRDIDSGE